MSDANTNPEALEPQADSEPVFDSLTGQVISTPEIPPVNLAVLEGLSNQLVWKIGKEEGSTSNYALFLLSSSTDNGGARRRDEGSNRSTAFG